MDVVEVEHGAELGVDGTGEEVQTAVPAQDLVGLFHHGADGGHAEDVIVSGTVGEVPELGHGVAFPRVEEDQLDAEFRRVFGGEKLLGPGQPGVVDVGDHQQSRTAGAVDGVVDGAQSHGTHAREDGQLAAFDDAHAVLVAAAGGVVVGMEGAHDAGHGFGNGPVEEGVARVGQQIAGGHDLLRDHHVGGVAADVLVGVTGGGERALVVDGGLDGELVAHLELALPLGAHFHQFAAELVTDDDGVLRHIVGNALVGGSLFGGLETGHADAVGNDPGEDLVLFDGGKFEGLQSQVFFTVKADSCGFHLSSLFLMVFLFSFQAQSRREESFSPAAFTCFPVSPPVRCPAWPDGSFPSG